MVSGIKALRRIQIGEETTKGTAVPATAALAGMLTMKESPTIHRPVEERGQLAEFSRSVKVANLAELTLESDATFEQILYLLHMGVLGNVVPPVAAPIGAKHDDGGVFADLTNTFDGNPATFETIVGLVAADDKIYVRSNAKFGQLRVDIGTTPQALASLITAIECSDGAAGWLPCTSVVDGTLSAGASMAIDGDISFVPPAAWDIDTVDADDGYWIRITWGGDWTANVVINEFYIISLARYWTFTPSMAAAGAFDSFTIEYGDDIEQWETEYCMASAIEISGAMNEPMKVRGDIFGRKMTVCAAGFTGPFSVPTVESVLTQKARLYIDDETGKIGGTIQSDTLISFTYAINTGLGYKRFADGSIDFSSYGENFKGVELRMTFAFNAGAEVERLKYDGSTQRIVRIEALGSEAQTKEDSTDAVGAGNWTDVATNLLVTASANFTVDRVIIVDTERILVTALPDATHITGVRGYEGTIAAAHTAAATIYFVHDKRLRLDFSGIYTDWGTLDDRDGEDVVSVTMSPERGTTYTKLFEMLVVNTVVALP